MTVRVLRPNRNEEIWVETRADGMFEVGVQLHKTQYSYLEITREQLNELYTNVGAALLDTPGLL